MAVNFSETRCIMQKIVSHRVQKISAVTEVSKRIFYILGDEMVLF